MIKRLMWLPHNLIAHPLMVFLPDSWGQWLHDWTIPNQSKDENDLSGNIVNVDDDTETME